MGDFLRTPYQEVPLGDTPEVIWRLFFEQYAIALPEWERERLLDSVAVAQAATEESCEDLRCDVQRLTPTLGVHAEQLQEWVRWLVRGLEEVGRDGLAMRVRDLDAWMTNQTEPPCAQEGQTFPLLAGLLEEGRVEPALSNAWGLIGRAINLLLAGQISPAWEELHEVTATLPLLGECNRQRLARALGRIGWKAPSPHQNERTVHLDPADSPRDHVRKGLRAVGERRLDVALWHYERASKLWTQRQEECDPEASRDLAGVLTQQGIALGLLKKDDDAAECFRAVVTSLALHAQGWGIHARRVADLLELRQAASALAYIDQVRQGLTESRRRAGIDETNLEFLDEQNRFVALAVRTPLRLGRCDKAFAAVQDGKATVLSDLAGRPPEDGQDLPRHLREVRSVLTGQLRQGERPPDDVEARRAAAPYLHAFRFEQSARRRGGPPLPPATLETIQQALLDGWAILDFWLDGEELTAFLVTRDSLETFRLRLPCHQPVFQSRLHAWRQARTLQLDFSDEILDDLGAHVYHPLRAALLERGVRGLYLVPHGLLHGLPLHAARLSGRYLCDEFEVAYLPSAAMLPRLPAPDWRGRILSVANPERGTEHGLPFAEWEGARLQEWGDEADCFERGARAGFGCKTRLREAALIHFSGHGRACEAFAPLSHLRLAEDLLLAHDVVHHWPALRPGSLIVLNGCETAVPDGRAIDEGLGLMTAFLLRGAGLVLATQWWVFDPIAAEMVTTFLDELLHKSQPPTEALRAARRRAAALSLDDLLGRCDQVARLLDGEAFGVERERLDRLRASLLSWAGRAPAERRARRAEPLLRGRVAVQSVSGGPPFPLDHPIFWAAFQLVGRVC